MTENVLALIDSRDLAVHVVWTPVLKNDDMAAARKAVEHIPDPRATHYWDAGQDLGMVYGEVVELPRGRELAWDIYFAFGRGVLWNEGAPVPDDWAHQLGTDERRLQDGQRLREALQRLLEAGATEDPQRRMGS